MFDHNRQHVQNDDSKADEWFGKFFGAGVLFVMLLAAVQFACRTFMAWYRDTMVWLDDTAIFVAGLWPF